MHQLLSKEFWSDAGERAIKTGAQVAIASIGSGAALQDVDWVNIASIIAVSIILSVLTSIASIQVSDSLSLASAVKATTSPKHAAISDGEDGSSDLEAGEVTEGKA